MLSQESFHRCALAALAAVLLLLSACSSGTNVPAEVVSDIEPVVTRTASRPALRVVSPASGATVSSPFVLEIETENLELAPDGAVRDGEAHLHVITTGTCVPAGEVIMADDKHVRYTDGTASLSLDLPPGDYDICVQAGDGFHVALGISAQLSITVLA